MLSCCPIRTFHPARGAGRVSDPISEGCPVPEIFGNKRALKYLEIREMVVTFPLIHDIIDQQDISDHGECGPMVSVVMAPAPALVLAPMVRNIYRDEKYVYRNIFFIK